ncbi:MAG: hypothetical protein AB8H79_23845 [Myxococcota bacterium]
MSDKQVGELFGERGTAAKPRVARIIVVLISGMLLTFVGMVCSAVPGGLVTLVAWALVERELGRVDSGYLPIESRPSLAALRLTVLLCLVVVLLLFIVQGVLLCNGVYFQLWTAFIELFRPMVDVAPAPTPV